MSGMVSHEFGCGCRRHVEGPWNRPEHWSRAEVDYLESHFGRFTDAAIAKHLGRTAVGVRLKAKRLGIHKRDVGLSGSEVARLLGVDATTALKVWIQKGLLRARRTYYQGPYRVRVSTEEDVARFIREHGHWIDLAKVPVDSPFRELAEQHCRWISIVDAALRLGRNSKYVLWYVRGGLVPGRRRGTHWYIPEAEVAKLPAREPEAVDYARFVRVEMLRRRNDRRKGIAA